MKESKIIDLEKKIKKQFIKSKDGVNVLELEKNDQYSIAYGELAQGEENKKHKMDMQEIYYFIEGKGVLWIAGNEIEVKKGMIVKVKENQEQKIRNTGRKKLRFLMIVNPPYDEKKEEIIDEKA